MKECARRSMGMPCLGGETSLVTGTSFSEERHYSSRGGGVASLMTASGPDQKSGEGGEKK